MVFYLVKIPFECVISHKWTMEAEQIFFSEIFKFSHVINIRKNLNVWNEI